MRHSQALGCQAGLLCWHGEQRPWENGFHRESAVGWSLVQFKEDVKREQRRGSCTGRGAGAASSLFLLPLIGEGEVGSALVLAGQFLA